MLSISIIHIVAITFFAYLEHTLSDNCNCNVNVVSV